MNLNNLNYIFTLFILVMCIALSYFMLFTSLFDAKMSESRRITFVVILMAYAAFRGYRLYKSIREEKSNAKNL
ncbi:MAG: hypothetical protein E6Q37_09320 [Crocinitomicaceae bacterium]|nr:MAG: hypothetical protein E6Q37_09320 [Crocinitomicaceae bacterium]